MQTHRREARFISFGQGRLDHRMGCHCDSRHSVTALANASVEFVRAVGQVLRCLLPRFREYVAARRRTQCLQPHGPRRERQRCPHVTMLASACLFQSSDSPGGGIRRPQGHRGNSHALRSTLESDSAHLPCARVERHGDICSAEHDCRKPAPLPDVQGSAWPLTAFSDHSRRALRRAPTQVDET